MGDDVDAFERRWMDPAREAAEEAIFDRNGGWTGPIRAGHRTNAITVGGCHGS
jgi:hypothetical protein